MSRVGRPSGARSAGASAAAQNLVREAQQAFLAGRLDRAESLASEAARHDRRSADALLILGMCANRAREPARALSCLQKARKIAQDHPQILTQMAVARFMQGKTDEALRLYDRALRAAPDDAAALWGKANLLDKSGRPEEALELIDQRAGVPDAHPELVTLSISLLTRLGRINDAIDRAEKNLGSETRTVLVKRDLHFALGRALLKRGSIDDAFRVFADGNGLLPRFDRAAHSASIDELIEFFTPKRLKSLPRSSQTTVQPVFIVGLPRCGSTLIERVLDAHPDARGAGELPAFPAMVGGLSSIMKCDRAHPWCLADAFQADLDNAARHYLKELLKHGRHAKRLVDKMLNNYANLGLISLLLPGSRIVHCERDPLDLGLSCYLNLSPMAQPWAARLEDIGFVWREYRRLMDHWREALEHPVLHMRYEQIVANPEAQSRTLIDFVGLEWNDACLSYHESERQILTHSYDQANRPMYQSSVGRWKAFASQLEPLRRAIDEGA